MITEFDVPLFVEDCTHRSADKKMIMKCQCLWPREYDIRTHTRRIFEGVVPLNLSIYLHSEKNMHNQHMALFQTKPDPHNCITNIINMYVPSPGHKLHEFHRSHDRRHFAGPVADGLPIALSIPRYDQATIQRTTNCTRTAPRDKSVATCCGFSILIQQG